tara:strand:+ start:510 stop:2075 length:1566 start_codon:yes stop_codon:yes gene_type:complete
LKKKYFNSKIIYTTLLFLSSFFFNFYYGYIGVYPIDSFLIYNSGYNVLNGFHPFKDFWSVTGPLLDYIQFFFFFLFDVNWFSYVLHSSFINFLIVIFSFYYFVKSGLQASSAFIYSLSISILAYPLIGTPFVDNHAVIFALISIGYLNLGIILKRDNFFNYSAIFITLSFLSKQIPSAYILIVELLVILIYVFFANNKNFRPLINYLLSLVILLALILFFFFINNIPIKNFIIQYLFYPISLGESRMTEVSFNINNTISQLKFIYFSLFPIFLLIFILWKKKNKDNYIKKDLIVLTSTILMSLLFIYSQIITRNQVFIFFLIPFYLGLSHAYFLKYYNKKFILTLILVLLTVSTLKYHLRFNHDKKFMELTGFNIKLAVNAKTIDAALSGLKWISSDYKNNPQEEIDLINQTKRILKDDKSNKIYITDYQFFQSITKNEKISPNKWFDAMSIPKKDNKYSIYYKFFFLKSIKKQKIETIYIISRNREEIYSLDTIIDDKKCLVFDELNSMLVKLDLKNCRI